MGNDIIHKAEEYVRSKPHSTLGDLDMEGVVCRPVQELRDRCGNRVIVKIKARDFSE